MQAPFRADHVGSLLRPKRLKDAREQFRAGTITRANLREIEDEEIARVVRKQQEIGLQGITDGEFRRAWWHLDFLEGLDGVEGFDTEQGIQFHGTQTKSRSVRVVGKIDFTDHPMLEDYRFLHGLVGPQSKLSIPSPSMLHLRGQLMPGVYDERDAYYHDLAMAYRKAIRAFYDAGCRYIQLDDTSWATTFCSEESLAALRAKGIDPEQLKATNAAVINQALADRPSDLRITMHICRGNFRSTWMTSGGYEPVAEVLFQQLQIDGFFLEYDSDRAGDFHPLRFVNRPDLNIVLGLVTSKHGALEHPDDIKRKVDEATRYVPLEQLCLSPQCGFASTEEGNLLTEDEQ
ncbi:5-methyltetrahydropteroyltriglutamate--homocysteine methyltransferase [Alicyclobacillus cycloheptanicus]|uniref:5-methyltetrahydropteroyltriglutamate--homocysteine methyltransferase n=1 Tax=Alicyclobacillus cycloheptanicus TaxID=1457 RepID=A0ABT9XKI1_9BACL|nr:5-methyltetrahydropteroyltriglutamate--homocysteine methyltransferase [Alicyclobacillus cycloheptanicus]